MRTVIATAGAALIVLGGGSGANAVVVEAAESVCDPAAAPAARLAPDATVHEPNDVTPAQAAAIERLLQRRLEQRGGHVSAQTLAEEPVTINVHVHVITRDDGTGDVRDRRIDRQIRVLNRAFSGETSDRAADTGFRLVKASTDRISNTDWFRWSYFDDTDDRDAKRALRVGGAEDLNVYITNLRDGLLGYATFPWDQSKRPRRDGVVIARRTLPGGPIKTYGRGDTLTHEAGHWLGLFHTFQGGCSGSGDQVKDTPDQLDGATNVYECDPSLDTCWADDGRDPVHNFMNYTSDACLDRFTPGQAERIVLNWDLFRAPQT